MRNGKFDCVSFKDIRVEFAYRNTLCGRLLFLEDAKNVPYQFVGICERICDYGFLYRGGSKLSVTPFFVFFKLLTN